MMSFSFPTIKRCLGSFNCRILREELCYFPRTYFVRIVDYDGSSYIKRMDKPYGVIYLNKDINLMNDNEKQLRLLRIKTRTGFYDRPSDWDQKFNFELDDTTEDQDLINKIKSKK